MSGRGRGTHAGTFGFESWDNGSGSFGSSQPADTSTEQAPCRGENGRGAGGHGGPRLAAQQAATAAAAAPSGLRLRALVHGFDDHRHRALHLQGKVSRQQRSDGGPGVQRAHDSAACTGRRRLLLAPAGSPPALCSAPQAAPPRSRGRAPPRALHGKEGEVVPAQRQQRSAQMQSQPMRPPTQRQPRSQAVPQPGGSCTRRGPPTAPHPAAGRPSGWPRAARRAPAAAPPPSAARCACPCRRRRERSGGQRNSGGRAGSGGVLLGGAESGTGWGAGSNRAEAAAPPRLARSPAAHLRLAPRGKALAELEVLDLLAVCGGQATGDRGREH